VFRSGAQGKRGQQLQQAAVVTAAAAAPQPEPKRQRTEPAGTGGSGAAAPASALDGGCSQRNEHRIRASCTGGLPPVPRSRLSCARRLLLALRRAPCCSAAAAQRGHVGLCSHRGRAG